MRKTVRSLGHSLRGLKEAWKHERNLRAFVVMHGALVILAFAFELETFVILPTIAAGFFIVVELLNTALERLADTFDDCEKMTHAGHFHPGIKATKDVAAAASLIALCIYLGTLALMVLPYVWFVLTMPRLT